MIGSAIFYGEKLHAKRAFGILFSIFGAVYVLTKGEIALAFFDNIMVGDLYLLGAMLSWAIYSLLAKKYNSLMAPLKLQFYSSLFGTLVLLFFIVTSVDFAGSLERVFSLEAALSLIYLAIFPTVIGFYWFVNGITKLGAARASQFINLVPVFTIILGSVILGEFPDFSLYAGGFFVVMGLYMGKGKSIKTGVNPNVEK